MKLTKIRLVNWHIFSNQTISINGDTVISGENGHGKSTLIDAIYFVLSGGDEKYFNNAANNESERNLISYVRCKVGVEGKTYNRNESDILGHIALEFTENQNLKKHVLGCVISVNDNKAKKQFYSVDNLGVDDILYVNNDGKISDYDALKNALGNNFDGHASKRPVEIRKIIENLLQINDGNKYKQLLKKAIAFKPLNNEISSIVNEFLLNESRINIDDLKAEISGYREIAKNLELEKGKLECLTTFVDDIDKFLANKKILNYIEAVSLKSRYDRAIKEINKEESKIKTAKLDLERFTSEKAIEDKKRDDYKYELRLLKDDEGLKVLNEKQESKKAVERDLGFKIYEKNKVEKMIENETNIASELSLNYDFVSLKDKNDVIGLNKAFSLYRQDLKKKKESINHTIWENENVISKTKDAISLMNEEISCLKRGINTYDEITISLINAIKAGLNEKYHKDINVMPLCECFEITDERWRNAIEGYLSNQRFDLVVSGEYFKDSLKIYDKIADAKKIYEVGLIDTTKEEDVEVLDDSLFTKINVLNLNAETKLASLLGKVVCAETLDDLVEFKASITDNCMLYKNYVVRRLNPRRYEKHYIGSSSQSHRIDFLAKEIQKLKNDNEVFLTNNEKFKETLNVIKNTEYFGEDIKDVWHDVDTLQAQVDALDLEIQNVQTNPDFVEKQRQIDDFERKLNNENDLCKALNDKIIDASSEIQASEKLIEIHKEEKDKMYEDYTNEIASFAYDDEYKKFESSILDSKEFNPNMKREELREENDQLAKNIRRGMNEYYENFDKELGHDLDDADKYLLRYNQIKTRDIANFEDNAKHAFDNASRSFNEKFVTVLRGKIKDAQKNIRLINSILSKHKFGNDEEYYAFTYAPSSDKDLAKYYKIINNDKNYDEVDLFTENMTDEDRDTIKDLFDRISKDANDTNALQDLETYLDYRNYMSYDIEIKNKNGDKYLFSKIAKEKSGGETQTPFYIIIAACFEELIRNTTDESMAIIIYDEAFNNMDETRISTLLSYYRNLKDIQFLIAVPTNRLPLLLGQTDSCVGLVKKNNNVQIIYEESFLGK